MPLDRYSRFNGKSAIVTGGTCGIGRAIAMALLREGAQVTITTLPADEAQGMRTFQEAGFQPTIRAGDMSDEAFCRSIIAETADRIGRIDCLVNNAFSFVAKSTDATATDWDRSLGVGPIAYARMMAGVAESMKQRHCGSIVNISSISAWIAQPNRWTYNAAKGAVTQLTRCAAMDFGPFGIRVNSVSPGWTWTRENEKAAASDREKYSREWGNFALLRRMAQPDEIAGPVLFLLSDEASFITGTDLAVDGGYRAMGPEGLGQHTVVAGSR